MTRINRLHAEIVGALSCQAILGAVLAVGSEYWDAPATSANLKILHPDRKRCVVTSTSSLTLTEQEAKKEFPALDDTLTAYPEVAPAAEWEALALTLGLLQQNELTLTFGALPLPTELAEDNQQLIALLVKNHWPTRIISGRVSTHSLLAVAAYGGQYQPTAGQDSWQLGGVCYGQTSAEGSPDIMQYFGWQSSYLQDQVWVLAANIDDQNPEFYQDCLQTLLAEGALDVLLQPVYMKKQRPGILLSVICRLPDAERLSTIILEQTSTLGVRRTMADRYMLERRIVLVTVAGGSVRVKLGYQGEKLWNVAPEYEDCRRVAAATGTPVKLVYQQAVAAFWQGSSGKES